MINHYEYNDVSSIVAFLFMHFGDTETPQTMRGVKGAMPQQLLHTPQVKSGPHEVDRKAVPELATALSP